ncbi:MAG: YidC/Oxa1 family membrane protein insertase [Solirubrobacteraceae bacterium]
MLITANIFQPLISVFQHIIVFFHGTLGVSWGWSIVLLTVCVRLVLAPLAVKQFHGMRRMQQHQPEMKAIQRKYKADKQRQQEEMMKFYRENGINPFASCLPMVAQFPVFISLYYMLRKNLRSDICPAIQRNFQMAYAHAHHIALHAAGGQSTPCSGSGHEHITGAGFLFIHDITAEAAGITMIILIILYVGTQVVSTKLMAAPTMDKNQQRMMMFLPAVFVIFIIRFPTGLILYWITTNLWTMVQGYSIKRMMGPPPPPPPGLVIEDDDDDGGGLAGLLRGLRPRNGDDPSSKQRGSERAHTSVMPPPPPRKKKKRSGRRR